MWLKMSKLTSLFSDCPHKIYGTEILLYNNAIINVCGKPIFAWKNQLKD